jgi:hypothetical protein
MASLFIEMNCTDQILPRILQYVTLFCAPKDWIRRLSKQPFHGTHIGRQ